MDHFQFALLFWSAVAMLLLQPSAAQQPAFNWSVRLRHCCWGRKHRARRSRRFSMARLRVG